MSTFPGKQPEPVPGQIGLDEPVLSVYVCREAVKNDLPALVLFNNEMGVEVERMREFQINDHWTLRQHHQPQACGATVVLEWRE